MLGWHDQYICIYIGRKLISAVKWTRKYDLAIQAQFVHPGLEHSQFAFIWTGNDQETILVYGKQVGKRVDQVANPLYFLEAAKKKDNL